jgi:hypothetical protein
MRDRTALRTASVLLATTAACSAGTLPPPSPSAAWSSPPPASSAVRSSPQPSATDASETGPPPLSRLERTVIDALADLGIKAQRAQLPAEKSASVWAEPGGTHLAISAHRSGIPSDATVTSTRRIGEVVVRRVEYEAGSTAEQFTCAGIDYQVDGHPPPRFATADAFLARFLAELRCS